MRLLRVGILALSSVIGLQALASAQGLLKATVQHAKVDASASTTRVAPGGAVTLRVDVTPNPSVHIYAEGAKDVTPVALTLTPNAVMKAAAIKYPKSELVPDPASMAPVPAYAHAFRVDVPITIASTARNGDTLTLGGVLTYQACDDRMCYPVSTAPVTWQITVGPQAK